MKWLSGEKVQNRLRRNRALASKMLRIQLRNFTPTAIKGRISGPRVLLNSIPKAGTNLLEHALAGFPLLHRSGFRTLRGWDSITPATVAACERIPRGGVVVGHLPAHRDLLDVLATTDTSVLLMVRDPRDQLVSYVNYVTRIDKTHPAHAHFLGIPSEHERLMDAVKGVEGVVSSPKETLQRFSGWLKSGAMVVRFEDIIGAWGGGSDEIQLATMCEIASFIGLSVPRSQVENICSEIYSSKSITFNRAQVGAWRQVLSEEHLSELYQDCGNLLDEFGYSRN